MSDTNEEIQNPVLETQVESAPKVEPEMNAEPESKGPGKRGRSPRVQEVQTPQIVIEDAPLIKVTAAEAHLSPQTLLEMDAGRRALAGLKG